MEETPLLINYKLDFFFIYRVRNGNFWLAMMLRNIFCQREQHMICQTTLKRTGFSSGGGNLYTGKQDTTSGPLIRSRSYSKCQSLFKI